MITLTDALFSYDGQKKAVDDVSLHVDEGEFLCVLGPNGSGKSTLARLMNGLLVPTQGIVRVAGFESRDETAQYEIRSRVALVFQNPDDALVTSIVEDEVAFGPANLGASPDELRHRVDDCLRLVGLDGFQKRDVSTLSGGQKQRVAIAAALAMAPQVLVLDEATAMLDPQGRKSVMEIVRALHAQGLTIVMVTHFAKEAALAERLIVMSDGRVMAEGTPQQLLAQKRSVEAWKNSQGVFPPDDSAILQMQNVTYAYGEASEAPALKDVSIRVRKGEFFGVAGATGSGKSTLLRLMNGLLSPTEGQILFEGRLLSSKGPLCSCRGKVGLVFQYPEQQLFANTVFDDVAFGPRNLGLDEGQVSQRVQNALMQVGLDPDEVASLSPFRLSGGQQRRVAIAGILSMDPEILILDEPTAGLDECAHEQLILLLRNLNEQGKTIVLVSHSMNDLATLCDAMVVLDHGQVALSDSPRQVFSDRSTIEALGLEMPFDTHVCLRAVG